ncbi:MAG: ABC transporter substrate-binding protein [Rhizobiales bacterium]|nr:ABC transporter substrate-binding protein [Hyphomicrobiales bacterium]
MKGPVFLSAALLAAALLAAPAAQAADPVTLQLKWIPQAQFAGYYVAKAKGFYDEVGLDVTINAGGPDIAPEQVIAANGADVIVNWLSSSLAAREKGLPLVNIAQFFNKSGANITCYKDSGITSPVDFKGKSIGTNFNGNEFPVLAWMSNLGYSVDGPNPDVKLVKLSTNVDPFINKQIDCTGTQIYNEYLQLIDSGTPESELVTFFFSDNGVGTLEDGLYTTQAKLDDPVMAEKLARLVKASIKGWQYAIDNQAEAAQIVVDSDPSGVAEVEFQKRQIERIAKLIPGSPKGLGYLDPAAYDITVNVLLAGKTNPVITKKPEGAYTHAIWEKATAQ